VEETITTDATGRATATFIPAPTNGFTNYGVTTIRAYPLNQPTLLRTATYSCPNVVIN